MPQRRTYKSGSVIYFDGEAKGNDVFLLKSGVCTRTKIAPSNNSPETSRLIIGEFFGIKSAMGNFARDETIQVLQNSEVFVFTPKEFEAVIQKNVNIIFKMLQAFSNELRKIHHAIEGILNMDAGEEAFDQASKLMYIGNYYYSQKAYSQARYAFEKFLEYNPRSSHVDEVKTKLEELGRILSYQTAGQSSATPPPAAPVSETESAPAPAAVSASGAVEKALAESDESIADAVGGGDKNAPIFNQALAYYRSGDYNKADGITKKIIGGLAGQLPDGELYEKIFLTKARLDFYNGDYNSAINSTKAFVGRYKSSQWLYHGLYIIAQSYLKMDNANNAKVVFKKIAAGTTDQALVSEVNKELGKLGP